MNLRPAANVLIVAGAYFAWQSWQAGTVWLLAIAIWMIAHGVSTLLFRSWRA